MTNPPELGLMDHSLTRLLAEGQMRSRAGIVEVAVELPVELD